MKKNIHPNFFTDAQVICACGNTWTTGSTRKVIRTDVCSKCHPFFTGEQRIVDTEGQVDRFYKKLQARQQFAAEAEARQAARTSLERPISELELGTRLEHQDHGGHAEIGDAESAPASPRAARIFRMLAAVRRACP